MTVLLIGLLSCQNQKPAENGSFTTASYNLRYANAEDSAAGNGWGKRYPVMAKLIQYHSFDIFGTQEGYIRQLEDMKAALPGYEYIGVGRNDGKEAGEHSAIFYRTDKFDLIKKGDFWLSETPDTASIGWDAVLVAGDTSNAKIPDSSSFSSICIWITSEKKRGWKVPSSYRRR